MKFTGQLTTIVVAPMTKEIYSHARFGVEDDLSSSRVADLFPRDRRSRGKRSATRDDDIRLQPQPVHDLVSYTPTPLTPLKNRIFA